MQEDIGRAKEPADEANNPESSKKIQENEQLLESEDVDEIKISEYTTDTIDIGKIENASSIQDRYEIKVYIIGCVNNPGIITIKEGQLLYEAIEAAGGVTEDADLQNINMVYQLTQNVMINILPKNIVKINMASEYGNDDADNAGPGVQIIKDTGDAVIQYTSSVTGCDKQNNNNNEADFSKTTNEKGKVNINKASIDELDTLPGIGKTIAESIIEYRESKGKFKKIEDIMNVPGIKKNDLSKSKILLLLTRACSEKRFMQGDHHFHHLGYFWGKF